MWDRVIDGMVGRIESLSEECCELEIGCSAQKEIAHARNAEFNGVVSLLWHLVNDPKQEFMI